MNRPETVSRAEWLGARKALLAKEKEFTRQRDTLIEPFALVWIHLAVLQGMGSGFGFRLMRRGQGHG